MRYRVSWLCLLLLAGMGIRASAAQQGSSGGDQFNATSPYAGLNPLDGRPETFPSSGNPPKCVPPINTWKLIAQKGGQCSYFAPDPINGYVTSINNVGALQKFYVKCGLDPFDSTKVICQNPGDDRPGAAPTTGPPVGSGVSATGRNGEVFSGGANGSGGNPGGPSSGGGSTASTGNYRRQPVQVPANPCEPNYNMSTAAGRAAAVQNAPQDQQACNEERCKHNPELSVCGGPPETVPTPVPIVPGPAAQGPQPRRAGPSVPGPAMPTPVPAPPASVPPAATPPAATPTPANPGPTQRVNLWKGQFNCDGKNCVFVDQNGNRWAGPQVMEINGGVYQIDPKQFQVNRIRTSTMVQALGTYRLTNLLPGYGSAPATVVVPFNMR